MLNDFSYAFRTLRKSPIFTITVVVTIALAIGASTAIFSVTNGVLLRQLPYKDPERLVLPAAICRNGTSKTFPFRMSTFSTCATAQKTISKISLPSVRFAPLFLVWTARLSGSAWPRYQLTSFK